MNEKKKESRSGMEIMNLLQVSLNSLMMDKVIFVFILSFSVHSNFHDIVSRKKGGSAAHGTERRPTMTSIKRLYVE